MASRKKRKRYRQTTHTAEATAREKARPGGLGACAYTKRSDFAMVRRAIRERWEIPEATWKRIVAQAGVILDDSTCSPNLLLSMMRTMVRATAETIEIYGEAVTAVGRLEAERHRH